MKVKLASGVAAVLLLAACGSPASSEARMENDTDTKTQIQTDTIMKPIELTKAEFLQKVANFESSPNEWHYLGDRPALIDFYASWCGPCRMVAPILEELAGEYEGKIVVYKVNTEKEPDLAAAFGIRSIPSILFIPMSGKPQMLQGAMPKDAFKKAIEEYLLK
mgnify:CR=1 FL=1